MDLKRFKQTSKQKTEINSNHNKNYGHKQFEILW